MLPPVGLDLGSQLRLDGRRSHLCRHLVCLDFGGLLRLDGGCLLLCSLLLVLTLAVCSASTSCVRPSRSCAAFSSALALSVSVPPWRRPALVLESSLRSPWLSVCPPRLAVRSSRSRVATSSTLALSVSTPPWRRPALDLESLPRSPWLSVCPLQLCAAFALVPPPRRSRLSRSAAPPRRQALALVSSPLRRSWLSPSSP